LKLWVFKSLLVIKSSRTHGVTQLCKFLCVLYVFFCPWFCVLWFSILCFGRRFLFVVGELYIYFKYDELIECFYIILCGVWTTIGVGADMASHVTL
jgi:hypothetical protein